ncbi:MAG: putative nucleic acid-binding protein [Spirosomataceae bacterium]|jgi:predicted nucleic acid-binding protein
MIALDTSILIEYFRRSKKENSVFYKIAQTESYFAISSHNKI